MEIAVVAGFAAFLGKYLEQQFNFTTTSANQLLGPSSPQARTGKNTLFVPALFFLTETLAL